MRRSVDMLALLTILGFVGVYSAMQFLWHPPVWIAACYAAMSLITFIVYAIDKSAAKAHRWRTSEATLHLMALAGGWPGALLAQQWLRHKSAKQAFRVVFWMTVVLNVTGLVVLCSPWGLYSQAV